MYLGGGRLLSCGSQHAPPRLPAGARRAVHPPARYLCPALVAVGKSSLRRPRRDAAFHQTTQPSPARGQVGSLSVKGLVFVHIQKAGGLTLRAIVRRQYRGMVLFESPPEDFDALPADDRRRIEVLQAHVPFGVHRYLDASVDYITMLRDPVDRILSLFFYLRGLPDRGVFEPAVRSGLLGFVEMDHPQMRNFQTRLLAGLADDPDRDALRAAKENLATRFASLGFAPRFDEALLVTGAGQVGGGLSHRRRNTTASRPASSETPSGVIAAIRASNALDIELLAFADEM